MYRLIMVIGAMAAIGIAAGCGSSGEEATSAPLTKAQFIKQADAICETVRKQRIVALTKLEKQATKVVAEANEAAKDVVAPSLNYEAEELKDLEAPQSEKAMLDELAGTLSEMSKALARKSSDVQAATALLPQYAREASALGVDKCQQP